jgi:beta-galactosidase/beta-glucuronidase
MSSKNTGVSHGLVSKYAPFISQTTPLNDYPRPQLQRAEWINLNGWYDYVILDRSIAFPDQFTGKILVPYAVETAASGVRKSLTPNEKIWYRRSLEVPELSENERMILHFEAVDYECEIFLNQRGIGKNTGGYLPFEFDITDFVSTGMNELIIGVTDPTDQGSQERGKQVLDPKGIWYTATSGIWQTVWCEIVNDIRIADLRIIPDPDRSLVRIKPTVTTLEEIKLTLSVFFKGKLVRRIVVKPDCFNEIELPEFQWWSPENPQLYDIKIDLSQNGMLKDSIRSYFGMRKFHIGKDDSGLPRLFLNNRPYFQTGVLDQGYFPESGLTPPTDQAMVDDIQAMKSMGFNMLRKHIKVEPSRWYYHCDRLGMLVWQDMPSGGKGTPSPFFVVALPNIGIRIKDHHYPWFRREDPQGRAEFQSGLQGMIDHLFNHPSICCWVPFNEGWGQFDAKQTADFVKQIDPSRFVDHASGWYDQGGKDFVSVHKYVMKIRKPHTDRERPFVLSEFGGYSLILPDHVWDHEQSFGYRMFDSEAHLTEAYANLIKTQVLPLVRKGLCATVYTQLSDVETEVNGLLTYDRSVIKMDVETVRHLNETLKNM